jgi:acetyl esterase/lipase
MTTVRALADVLGAKRPGVIVRRRVLLVVVAVLVLVASGCDLRLLVPSGDAPLRYRDEVFASVTKTGDLVYGNAVNEQGNAQDLVLDLYEPTGDTVDARPAIVWIHGGGFSGGSKTSAEIVEQANLFAKKGYVTVSISYRLSQTGCSVSAPTANCVNAIIDAREDAQAAVRWLRANSATYGVDVDRIAVGGTSAGAITALNVGYGPETPGASGNPGHSSAVAAAVSLSGAHVLTTPNAGEAKALLFHGTADTVVPSIYAQATVDAALDAGLVAELTSWDGAGHVPYSAHRTEINDQTTNFLYHAMALALAAQ